MSDARKAKNMAKYDDESVLLLERTCESAGLGSFTLSKQRNVIQLSDSLCAILGIPNIAGGLPYDSFVSTHVHPEDVWFVREYQRSSAKRKYLFRAICKDGKIRWLEAFPSLKVVEETEEIFGVVQDVTERVDSEDGIQNARKMESVRSIAGGISHEFNNILYSMAGYIGLMKELVATVEGPDGDEMKEFLGEIEFGSKRAVRLIKKIQTFSHSGKQGIRKVLLNDAARKALSGVPLPENIQCELEDAAKQDVWVYANDNVLIESISNIIINGVAAMESGGDKLKVSVNSLFVPDSKTVQCGKLQTGYYGCVQIQDTGCGMDKNTVSRIFEPFFTTKEAGRGTGLGLAIVFGMVNAAGGAVAVDSKLGKGSTFRVFLPACSSVSDLPDSSRVAYS